MARPKIPPVEKKYVHGISLNFTQSARLDVLSEVNGNNRSLTVQKWINKAWTEREDRINMEKEIESET